MTKSSVGMTIGIRFRTTSLTDRYNPGGVGGMVSTVGTMPILLPSILTVTVNI